MKIAIMSAWNSDSGASVLAELIGHQWEKMGHKLTVFSFLKEDFHGTTIAKKDESYVKRCFTTNLYPRPYLDYKPILNSSYDIFIINDIKMLPLEKLYRIFPKIKEKAKTVNIVHENKPFDDKVVLKFEWGNIVCFDHRYKDFLKKNFSKDKISIIPYPCFPYSPGNQLLARKKLHLPSSKKIILTVGQSARLSVKILPWIKKLVKDFQVMVLGLTTSKETITGFKRFSDKLEIEVRNLGFLPLEYLYQYLHASDLLIFNRESAPGVVVSSTAFQCLGSGCPIVARDSNFIETLNSEILKYRNEEEFLKNVIDIFNKGPKYQETTKTAKKYVEENSASKIAQKYINLFKRL